MNKCIIKDCESETRHISTKNEVVVGVVDKDGVQKYHATRNYKCDNLHLIHRDATYKKDLLSKTPKKMINVKHGNFYE